MKKLKQIAIYTLWTIVSIVLGIMYMRIVLGANNIPKEGLGYLAHMFYNWGLFHVGLIIGLVITLLFILLDVFCLKKKLKNNGKLISIQFGALMIVTAFVIVVH
ncbi:hypothetical protein P8625_14040 [Tenacibaculum tangerinum]|uniref:Uncharacterized protein n=1 Tax=Tenacibaculum tangerinum TaxID=3038772 RepID=A0ABY8L131_9FLAO|nr:hypothetical protein [Tenacibaculum tangerinum]WGH75177.1 hypothetical protein P8625_14040 [Tenacibaculum tangerinum]